MPRSDKFDTYAATAAKPQKATRPSVSDPVLARRVHQAQAAETSIDISDLTDEEFLADIERRTVRA